MDLALNNLQRLICHKTQQTKPNLTEGNLYLKFATKTKILRIYYINQENLPFTSFKINSNNIYIRI